MSFLKNLADHLLSSGINSLDRQSSRATEISQNDKYSKAQKERAKEIANEKAEGAARIREMRDRLHGKSDEGH